MSYEVTITKKANFLHAIVSGKETLENLIAAWKEIAEACQGHKCKRILVDGCLDGPGDTLDIYNLGNRFHELGIPLGARIAMACKEEDVPKLSFAEVVVKNRNPVTTKIFLNKDDAVQWLTKTGTA
jgi:hypothetical protein